MKSCTHKISFVANIFCSEAIPAKCSICGCKVIRIHNNVVDILKGIFAFGGVLLVALLFIFIEYAGVIIFTGVALSFLAYCRGIAKSPLVVFSREEQLENKQRSKKQLIGLVIFVIVAISAVVSET
ncbi:MULTISPECIES: hypothetical protein [unclassified Agarivorans]|uniref:hypothetical protein n=1 Tax=unclassified Agarivorans TaxID=2636026 RepID=UPI0026E41C5E|nr:MULTISPECIES: hypothetical protein [unclassified Agarivorans]MDO6687506.1 hypothetical protein [Agarivorans sp. 3_MG-2023]MDO6717161.1 hypothetical protein [Agarivorans sp. 2_MG-2023]